MRRVIANSLLLIMLGMFFAPMFAAELPAPVPQCCLRGGKHHCDAMLQLRGDQKSFCATNNCPVHAVKASPVSAAISSFDSTQVELRISSLIDGAVVGQRRADRRARHLRGPPAILS